MKSLASRNARITTSQTVAIDAKYKRLKSEGKDVLSLGAGEPDLDTPDYAKEAAILSIRQGLTKYSSVTGLPPLKQAISRKFTDVNGLAYTPDQITVSGGAKHCVFNTLMALIEEGDEVLIPSPCWVTYPELVLLLGGKPVLIPTTLESGFKVTAEQLQAAITEKSKLFILNSPANPTGAVYTEQELRQLAWVVVENDLYCLSDEIYEHIVYGDARHVSIGSLGLDIFCRTATVNGMSKAYAMTGWRIGYVGAPPALAAAIASIQSHGTHHPANASQYAALACLEADQGFVMRLRAHLNECRTIALGRLERIPGLRVCEPQGAFYVFFDVQTYLGKSFHGKAVASSMDLCEYLLDEQLLATVPGSSFGLEGYMRISFASGLPDLEAALARLERGLLALE